MGQRKPFDKLRNVPCLRLRRFQELSSGRCIVKQIPADKCGSVRSPDLLHPGLDPALDTVPGSDQALLRLCDQLHTADGSDAGECLTPESEGSDAGQIIDLLDFAGGMAQEGRAHLVRRDPGSVIGHPDHRNAAVPDLHRNGRRAGIDGILGQLLDDASRPLYDLPGRNLVNCRLLQQMDYCHDALLSS